MFNTFRRWFSVSKPAVEVPVDPPKFKKIAFIDGDQGQKALIAAYTDHVDKDDTVTHYVSASSISSKVAKYHPEIIRTQLQGFSTGKEIVDKYIGAAIQKAIGEGFNHITVISSDYDFIDIFKLITILDETASNLTFRMIVPRLTSKTAPLPAKLANIEVIKCAVHPAKANA